MLNTDNVKEYLEEVRAHADKIGLREQLESRLKYLDRYANQDNNFNDKTECVLFKDFAPYSFEFLIKLRAREYITQVYKCDTCDKTLEDETCYDKHKCFFWDDETRSECKGTLKIIDTKNRAQKEERWFNGGLIFHGPHDNGGDGGAPTFSVNLLPQDGWSIHT